MEPDVFLVGVPGAVGLACFCFISLPIQEQQAKISNMHDSHCRLFSRIFCSPYLYKEAVHCGMKALCSLTGKACGALLLYITFQSQVGLSARLCD